MESTKQRKGDEKEAQQDENMLGWEEERKMLVYLKYIICL